MFRLVYKGCPVLRETFGAPEMGHKGFCDLCDMFNEAALASGMDAAYSVEEANIIYPEGET